jgi:hypothetical protein
MKPLEDIRQAVLGGDLQLARRLLDSLALSPTNIEQVAEIRNLLEWALEVTKIRRAHAAAQLAEMMQSSAYQPRESNSSPTWSFNG